MSKADDFGSQPHRHSAAIEEFKTGMDRPSLALFPFQGFDATWRLLLQRSTALRPRVIPLPCCIYRENILDSWHSFRYTDSMPSPVKYRDIKRYMEQHGWVFSHVTGSHHIFKKPGCRPYPVPVHKGLVNYGYFSEVQKISEGR